MYVCGPTVYDDCHIGHIVGPVLFDSIARWMTERGYQVEFINNITDIDDKIINRSLTTGEPWLQITERYTEQYLNLLTALQVKTVTNHPRATAFIDEMIRYIGDLIDNGTAYQASDGVYFSIETQPTYGKLSGRDPNDMQAGARIDRNSELRTASSR
jgi:cysteinyl-tRNA synthetase